MKKAAIGNPYASGHLWRRLIVKLYRMRLLRTEEKSGPPKRGSTTTKESTSTGRAAWEQAVCLKEKPASDRNGPVQPLTGVGVSADDLVGTQPKDRRRFFTLPRWPPGACRVLAELHVGGDDTRC
jgi:hypothetical protein